MDDERAEHFGAWIAARRTSLGLSVRKAAELAGIDHGYLFRLEHGQYAAPRPDTLVQLAKALDLPLADVFANADYVLPTELPNYVPYLRTKFRDAPAPALDELAKQLARIARKYGFDASGPADGQDELPEEPEPKTTKKRKEGRRGQQNKRD